jgi:lysophospholipase L1-like esterase
MLNGGKMKKFIVFFMVCICLVVLLYGHLYWKDMSKAAAKEGRLVVEKISNKQNNEKSALINRLMPSNNKAQSLIDFLRYRALTQNKVIISVLGSNVSAGSGATNSENSWLELLKNSLKSSSDELQSLNLINRGYEGYSTTDLLKGNKVDSVINDKPDFVIFEDSMLNNYSQSISIKQTDEDLVNIMSKIQNRLPHAKILIMSSIPIANSNNKNSLDLKYEDYINESEKVISKNNWRYFNGIKEFNNKLKDGNILLVDILANDYVHLNEKGNSLLFEVLYDYFKQSSSR